MSEQTFEVGQIVRVNPDAEFRNNTESCFIAAQYVGMIRKVGHDPDGYLVSVGTESQSVIADVFNANELRLHERFCQPADPAPTPTGELQQAREALRALGDKLPPYEYAPELVRVIKAVDALEAQNAALEKDLASARAILRDYEDVLQNTLAPYALPGDDMEMAVGRVLKRIAALARVLVPFAALWQRWLDTPAYDGETPGAFTEWLYDESVFRVAHDYQRAYEALHTDEEGA